MADRDAILPTARPYDPDLWARRWAVALGVPLLILFFMPVWLPPGLFSPAGGWDWGWTVQGSTFGAWTAIGEFLPPGLAMLALGAGVTRSAYARRMLLLGSGSIPVAYETADLLRLQAGWVLGDALFPLALGVAVASTAASNHLRLRYPASNQTRRWTLGASIAVLAMVFFAGYRKQVWFGRYAIVRGTTVMAWIVPAIIVAYAALTILNCARRGTGVWAQLLALIGCSSVVAAPAVIGIMFRSGVESSGIPIPGSGDLGPPLLTAGAIAAQSFCHEIAPIALTALGLACWLEPRVRAHHRPPALAAVAGQFE